MEATSGSSMAADVVSLAPASARSNIGSDPLFALLKRYEAELSAFNRVNGAKPVSEQGWDNLAETTWSSTQDEIVTREPPATTAAGALLALDHVLQHEYLFGERDECAEQRMLWLLVKAARDYIAATQSAPQK